MGARPDTDLCVAMGLVVLLGWFGAGLLPDFKLRNWNNSELLREIRSIGGVFASVQDDCRLA